MPCAACRKSACNPKRAPASHRRWLQPRGRILFKRLTHCAKIFVVDTGIKPVQHLERTCKGPSIYRPVGPLQLNIIIATILVEAGKNSGIQKTGSRSRAPAQGVTESTNPLSGNDPAQWRPKHFLFCGEEILRPQQGASLEC